ncbi:MAG: hypothetical protein QM666_06555 [Acinetobacter sp.]
MTIEEIRKHRFDIELAQAVSAAMLGDKNAFEFISLSSSKRFDALHNNQINIGTYKVVYR